jgi:hypothetical protein
MERLGVLDTSRDEALEGEHGGRGILHQYYERLSRGL